MQYHEHLFKIGVYSRRASIKDLLYSLNVSKIDFDHMHH